MIRSLVSAFVSVALLSSGYAQSPVQFAALKSQVAALQSLCAQMIKNEQGLQAQISSLQHSSVQALAPFVAVDPNPQNGVRGPNITFRGANVHIVNGLGATTLVNGLGNLIIGYDELPNPNIFETGERRGSHNLVMGRWHKFFNTSYSSFVDGQWNVMRGSESAVISGYHNVVQSLHSVIVGGSENGINDLEGVIVGGFFNGDFGSRSVILGGANNHLAAASYSVLLGGANGDNQIFP